MTSNRIANCTLALVLLLLAAVARSTLPAWWRAQQIPTWQWQAWIQASGVVLGVATVVGLTVVLVVDWAVRRWTR